MRADRQTQDLDGQLFRNRKRTECLVGVGLLTVGRNGIVNQSRDSASRQVLLQRAAARRAHDEKVPDGLATIRALRKDQVSRSEGLEIPAGNIMPATIPSPLNQLIHSTNSPLDWLQAS